ncbi:MAG: TOBE-like domain-containing protein [Solirubrobacteraceae bacterium]|nr:TOBE-like domain-containing protein [Solirubrobacteraceae bacterium]
MDPRITTLNGLDEVGLKLGSGSVTALLGPSGGGKSALLHTVHAHDGVESVLVEPAPGGARQLAALLAALDTRPGVLLLDEPFSALDAEQRQQLRVRLREGDVTVILATHDQQEALEVADHVVVVRDGRVEQAGTPDEIYDAPASPVAMAAVGRVAQLGGGFVRPHDVDVHVEPVEGGLEAQIAEITRVGFEVRIRAELADGHVAHAAVTRHEALELELEPGQIVWLRPHRVHTFA